MKKKNSAPRKLGKGLSSLLIKDDELSALVKKQGRPSEKITSGEFKKNIKNNAKIINDRKENLVATHLLTPGKFQPRKNFNTEEIEELTASIQQNGILQPILVRPMNSQGLNFEIIAGERRWRAAQIAQIHEVPVIVRNFDDETALGVALVENLQRSDLNVLEEADGYRMLMSKYEYTQEKLSLHLGKSRSHIANLLRLSSLPEKLKTYLILGKISYGHVRTLLTLNEEQALEIALKIMEKDLSVRNTELLVKQYKRKSISKKNLNQFEDPNIIALEKELNNLLGLKVIIKNNLKNKGSLSIHYDNLEQLEPILDKLRWRPK